MFFDFDAPFTMPTYIITPNRDPLQDSLSYIANGKPLIELCKVALLDAFWGDPGFLFESTLPSPDAYFRHFESQIRISLRTWRKQYDIEKLKFHHLTLVVKMIRQNDDRGQIESLLSGMLDEDVRPLVGDLVDLIMRVVFMVPVWSIWTDGREESLTWHEGTLKGAFERHFRTRSRFGSAVSLESAKHRVGEGTAKGGEDVKFDKTFTAKSLEDMLNWRIIWTGNLLDHLSVRSSPDDRKSKELLIFHHAAFLQYQVSNSIYPSVLIEETIQTLSLLFPSMDAWVQDWYVRYVVQEKLDPEAARCKPLRGDERSVDKFRYVGFLE